MQVLVDIQDLHSLEGKEEMIDVVVDEKEQRKPEHGCARCPKRWGGHKVCHCGGCHETFTTSRNFDFHRRNGECLDPRFMVGVLQLQQRAGYSAWAGPGKVSAWSEEEDD